MVARHDIARYCATRCLVRRTQKRLIKIERRFHKRGENPFDVLRASCSYSSSPNFQKTAGERPSRLLLFHLSVVIFAREARLCARLVQSLSSSRSFRKYLPHYADTLKSCLRNSIDKKMKKKKKPFAFFGVSYFVDEGTKSERGGRTRQRGDGRNRIPSVFLVCLRRKKFQFTRGGELLRTIYWPCFVCHFKQESGVDEIPRDKLPQEPVGFHVGWTSRMPLHPSLFFHFLLSRRRRVFLSTRLRFVSRSRFQDTPTHVPPLTLQGILIAFFRRWSLGKAANLRSPFQPIRLDLSKGRRYPTECK